VSKAQNLRKAALILMSIPNEDAAMVLSKLDAKQVEAVSIEIAKIGRFTSDDQEQAILAFAEANPNALGGSSGGLDVAKTLLEKALGKDATATVENVQQSVEGLPFGFLRHVDPQNLLTFVNDEHPQTIALILCHLPSAYGAQVIAGLKPDHQLQVIRRIANMGQTSPEILEQVEQGLEVRMAALGSQSYDHSGGIPTVADILNVSDRATERSLLENLAQEDPELVEEIRRLMFVFDDIAKLTDRDVQTVFKNVETSQWAMALKGSSDDLKDKILGNMSQRAATILREEMEYLGSVRLSEVEAVQQQIVDVVRRLEDAGEISVHAGSEEEQFIQ
jgi:flagellar motor switch protein FliG